MACFKFFQAILLSVSIFIMEVVPSTALEDDIDQKTPPQHILETVRSSLTSSSSIIELTQSPNSSRVRRSLQNQLLEDDTTSASLPSSPSSNFTTNIEEDDDGGITPSAYRKKRVAGEITSSPYREKETTDKKSPKKSPRNNSFSTSTSSSSSAMAGTSSSIASSTPSPLPDEIITRDFSVRGAVRDNYKYVPHSLEDKRIHDEQTGAIYIHPTIPANVQLTEAGEVSEIEEMPTYASSFESAPEVVLGRLFSGIDGREPVLSPARNRLYRIHAQVSIRFGKGIYGGSGTLVGPRHLLTAGHNLFNPKNGGDGWAQSISVRCALDGYSHPFGQQRVIRAYTYKKWVDRRDEDFDIALFVLDQSKGNEIGWYGLSYIPNRPEMRSRLEGEFYIAGYPKEVSKTRYSSEETVPGREFQRMWRMSNRKENGAIKPLAIEPTKWRYEIDTSAGQSGSAIWYIQEDVVGQTPYIVGVHAYGETEDGTGNYGVRLTESKLKQVIQWISETYEVEEIPADPATSEIVPFENIEDQYKRLESLPSSSLETKIASGKDLPAAYGVMAERLLYGRLNQTIDKHRAFDYAQKAYETGDMLATFFLARMYLDENTPERYNREKYHELNEVYKNELSHLATREYAPRSQFYLAMIRTDDDRMQPYNIKEGLRLLRLSASNSYSPAEWILGSILLQSLENFPEIPRDTEEGMMYLERAVDKGFAPAELAYATQKIYFRNFLETNRDDDVRQLTEERKKEVKSHLLKSLELIRRAAQRGYAPAQYTLAQMLEIHIDKGPEIKQECIDNYTLALKNGYVQAIEDLRRLGVAENPGAIIPTSSSSSSSSAGSQ
ncbi:MAG: trypsin-like serine protease [Alphaproteobacteria bacterium]|nr:trypsin-like serine protease [Alphaproteobacteria bacterium]